MVVSCILARAAQETAHASAGSKGPHVWHSKYREMLGLLPENHFVELTNCLLTYFLHTDQWLLGALLSHKMKCKVNMLKTISGKHLSTYITKQILKFEGASREHSTHSKTLSYREHLCL